MNTPNDIVGFLVHSVLRMVSFLYSGMLAHDIMRMGPDVDTMGYFSVVIPLSASAQLSEWAKSVAWAFKSSHQCERSEGLDGARVLGQTVPALPPLTRVHCVMCRRAVDPISGWALDCYWPAMGGRM